VSGELEYWRANSGLKHITPPGCDMPEVELFPALQAACWGRVLEVGCGYGRLAGAFDPANYHGIDVNPTAIEAARRAHPDHSFAVGDTRDPPPAHDTLLLYTVALHIPDSALSTLALMAAGSPRIVIGEIMGRRWRRPGNPPVFNREPREYEQLFSRQAKSLAIQYHRYGTDLTLLVMDR
jgi:trans-aconitate methyltransferase